MGRGEVGRAVSAASCCSALPPHSPKLNGYVDEFYNFYDGELTMGPLNRALREWEAFYNVKRPHQSIGWLSPMEYLAGRRLEDASYPPPLSHMRRTGTGD